MSKKIIMSILMFVMVFSLCACGDLIVYQNTDSNTNKTINTENDIESTSTPTPTATSAQITAEETAATTTTTETTATTYPVYITKNPYSECVYPGGSCTFVAYAANTTGVTWIISNENTSEWYFLSTIMKEFPGVVVTGLGTSEITISNIPYELNGYKVQAKFEGVGGPIHTEFAYIWVNQPVPCWDEPFDYMDPYGNSSNYLYIDGRYTSEPWY